MYFRTPYGKMSDDLDAGGIEPRVLALGEFVYDF